MCESSESNNNWFKIWHQYVFTQNLTSTFFYPQSDINIVENYNLLHCQQRPLINSARKLNLIWHPTSIIISCVSKKASRKKSIQTGVTYSSFPQKKSLLFWSEYFLPLCGRHIPIFHRLLDQSEYKESAQLYIGWLQKICVGSRNKLRPKFPMWNLSPHDVASKTSAINFLANLSFEVYWFVDRLTWEIQFELEQVSWLATILMLPHCCF